MKRELKYKKRKLRLGKVERREERRRFLRKSSENKWKSELGVQFKLWKVRYLLSTSGKRFYAEDYETK